MPFERTNHVGEAVIPGGRETKTQLAFRVAQCAGPTEVQQIEAMIAGRLKSHRLDADGIVISPGYDLLQ